MEKKVKNSKAVNVDEEKIDVEVVSAELIDKAEYQLLKQSYDRLESVTDKIRDLLNDTVTNYLKIGYLLSIISEKELKELGCDSIYEYAKENFNIGETTTKNFVNVYKRFAIQVESSSDVMQAYNVYQVGLKDDFKDYSMSQLVELLPVKDEELENYTPDMTTKEIRSLKKASQLTDYEKDFYGKVEKAFKAIWREVVPQLKFDCKNKIEDSVITFNQYGIYEFNIVYRKKKIRIEIYANIDTYTFNINIDSDKFNYDCVYNRFFLKTLSDEPDESIIKKIVNFINNDCSDFIDKNLDKKENQDNENKIEELINKIKEDYKDKHLSLIDLKLGDFFDLYKLLDKERGSYKPLNVYLDKISSFRDSIPCVVFNSKDFKLVYLSKYSIKLASKIDDNLLLNIDNGVLYFSFIEADVDDVFSGDNFTIKNCFYEYLGYLSNYGLDLSDGLSLFSIYLELAKRWGAERRKEWEQEQAENAVEESEEDSEDEDQ